MGNKEKVNNKDIPSKEAEDVAMYLSSTSSTAKSVGRSVVFAIIATSWTLTFSDGKFQPTIYIKYALILAILYTFIDLLYYILTTGVYKFILKNYFIPIKDGFKSKQGKDPSKLSRKWMDFGFILLVIMSILLLISSILMILHILSLT